MTTIESHYNALRSAATYARSLVGRDWHYRRTGIYHTDLQQRVARRATELAAEDWPRVRSALAAQGAPLPDGPLMYSDRGWCCNPLYLDDSPVLCNRLRITDEPSYAIAAVADLQPALEREAQAAEGLYETYRRAVEQGVAVPPAD